MTTKGQRIAKPRTVPSGPYIALYPFRLPPALVQNCLTQITGFPEITQEKPNDKS